MKLYLFITLLLSVGSTTQITATNKCICTQLETQTECVKMEGCIWNSKQLNCEVQLRTTTTNTKQTTTSDNPCEKYDESTCVSQDGCGWELKKCVPFTSCGVYTLATNTLCQQIQKKCITDGTKCVELGDCSNYLTPISCIKNLKPDSENNFCFWDTSTGVGKCIDVVDCQQLPKYYKTDAECRNKIKYCTVNPYGGCIQSGVTCADQALSMQCYYDQNMVTKCSWNGTSCSDRNCDSAPIDRNTDALCKLYLPQCTTKLNGGCQDRKTCNDAKLSAACVTDASGNQCFWYENVCYDKKCENAPFAFTTLSDCQTFMKGCVPKQGGGCSTLSVCTSITLSEGCLVDVTNNKCFWDTTDRSCKQLTCSNAPKTIQTYAKCIEFKSDCTLDPSGKGCATRTCDNAPTSTDANIKTNYDCNQYLSGCITKQGGGCTTLTTCENITYELACEKDNQGRQCFWSSGKCYLKSCSNAPSTYKTHTECQNFDKGCTVNRQKLGCTDMECQVMDSSDICKLDKNGNRCFWVGLCYEKTCENATPDLNSDTKCRAYLSQCTVSHTGVGCMVRPAQCTEMTLESQCVNNYYGGICAWVNGKCYDKACFTAPQTSDYDTYEECQAYLTTCTVRSDGVGGCQDLNLCNTYTAARSCRYNATGGVCEMNGSVCADKACSTSPTSNNTNALCDTYKSGCIVNSSGNGCTDKPAACSGMTTSNQCTATSTNASGGPCAWVSGACVDRQCGSAPATTDYDTHTECNTFLDTCTVVATGTGGCITLLSSCPSYTSMRQCEKITGGGQCGWYNNGCTTRACQYAPDTNGYDSDGECSTYMSTCTVVRRIGGSGCTTRNSGCQNLSEHQCVYDSTTTQCVWDTSVTTPYCKTRTCTFTLGVTTFNTTNCNTWMSGCVSNNSANGCISKYSSCSSYTAQDNCIETSGGTICYWTGSACVNRSCSVTQSITDFNHTNCFAWLNTCTVNLPTTCGDKPATCAAALNYDQCYYTSGGTQCAWVSGACVDRTCTNHGYAVTSFTNTNCSNWMSSCSANPGATACETTRTCTNHGTSVTTFTHANCSGWLSTCTVNSGSTACIDKTCTNHGTNVTTFSNANCSGWLSTCKNNTDSTACVTNKTCTNHGSNVTVYNHTNCNAWLDTCTVSGNACADKTCYNHGTFVTTFNHANCNAWLSTCTVSNDGLSCEAKNCDNYGSNVTTFNNTNCNAWLSVCDVNSTGTACVTTRTCSSTALTSFSQQDCVDWYYSCMRYNSSSCYNKTCANYSSYITVLSHTNCQAWLYECSGTSSCFDKTCWNYGVNIVDFTHANCQAWLSQCTVNSTGDGCDVKTCTNYGTNLGGLTDANCKKWLPYCEINAGTTACQSSRSTCSSATSTLVGTWTYTHCEAYLYSCTRSGSSCVDKTCSNASSTYLLSYSHATCTKWSSTCTINISENSCIDRTCTNYGANLSSMTHAGCNAWLSSCTINAAGTDCEEKTCSNHGSNVTTFNAANCSGWLSSCQAGTGKCVTVRTCSNHSITSFNYANCSGWLDTCTNSGSSCIDKTCTNYGSNISYYNHETCTNYLSTCTINNSFNGCTDRTCDNYGENVSTFTAATCQAWLSYCTVNSTNDGCVSSKTCTNHGTAVTTFNHVNCSGWLSTCTVNIGGTACETRSCTNYGANVTSFTHANCYGWLNSCTVNSGGTACQEKNCTNHQSNVTSFTAINCYNWESTCTVNSNGTACITTRTCTNYGSKVTTFNHDNCNAWLSSCTVNGGATACMDKTCASATAALVTTFDDTNCASWLSSCTANAGATACVTKTCALAPGSITTKNQTNCQNWMSTCTGDGSNCIDKTCANYSSSVSASNCNNYLSTCTAYSPYSSCESFRTCAAKTAPFSVGNCVGWLSTCSSNSGDTACEDKSCTNYKTYITTFTHSNCYSWKTTCTNNSSNNACQDKTCTNYQSNISSFTHNNCTSWLSTCTNNSSSNACEERNCTNSSGKISVISDANCKAYWPACVMNSNKNGCEASCTNHGSAVTVFNHNNCYAWDTQCTVNSGSTACEKRSCTNYGSNVTSFTHTNCTNWLSTCTNTASACVERTCFNYASNIGSFSHSNCNSWFSQCTVNHDNTGCQMKTCSNHGSNVTTFTDTNCSNWLSYCVANYNATACTTSRTCTNHGSNVTTFNHYNCSQWLSTCTVKSGNTACEEKNCSNYSTNISSVNHVNCTNWNELCTYDGSSNCTYRTCTNYGSYVSSISDTNCFNWLFYCEANYRGNACINRSCINHASITINHNNCKNWLHYCTINSTGSECYTTRTCANAGIYITQYNHFTCEQWNSLCTVNTAGNGCEWKTCYNHKTQVTTFNDANCLNWMHNCQVNSDASGCEYKSCTNYGTRVQYPYSSTWCRYYLEECTSSSSVCALNTSYECKRTDYQTKLQQFNIGTCANWSSTCVPNTANSACVDRTCSNYTGILTTFNHVTCSGWLPSCTNNSTTGCQDRTCTNHGSNVTVFNHANCTGWLSSCTANAAGSACEPRTCSNHGSNVTTFTNSNCYNWLNTCTNNDSWGCVDRNCDNHTITSFTYNNCSNWLSICTVHPQGGSCVSVRNCSNYGSNVTTFNHANCQGWLHSCTVNSTNNGCIDKTCDNYGSNVTSFNHINCQGWLSKCTVNSSNNKCEQRTCNNHGTYVTSFTTTNCQNWLSICKAAPTATACEYKTCDNHSITTFNHTNCSNWLSYCTVSNDGKSCTTSRTCTNHGSEVTVFNHSNCINWLSTCTNNSTTACQDKTCTNHGSNISSVNHNNCQNWMFSCTVNGANCETKSCSNYGSNVVVYTHSNCNNWWSTCTVDSSNSGCTDKTCANTYGISSFTHTNCETWKSSCQLNKPTTCTSLQSNCGNSGVSYNQCYVDTNKDNCVWYNGNCTDRTCSNYTGTTFTHTACETWLSTCTVDSLATHAGCVTKPTACTNAGIVQDQCVSDRYGGNCVWVSTSCQARSCSNYSTAPFTHTNCENWLSSCTVDALATPAGCVTKQANCSGYSVSAQCEKTSGGTVCFWNGTSCENRTCELAAQTASFDTDAECKAFLSTCTVARVGECMNRLTNCSSYLQSSQCVKNYAGGTCFWNTVTSTCADITCSNAPTTKTTHSDCNSFLNTCTLAGSGSGCTNLNQCNNYTIEGQCVISNTNQICAWSGGQCYVKNCSTAASDTTRDTHAECQAYLNTCTVTATGIGGCVPLAACNTYTSERQCVQNTSGQPCGWNGTKCDDKSCTTAPPTLDFSSDSACESYLTGCTVIPTGTGGCQIRAQACANYTTIRQCVKTITNQSCYWNGTTCVERTCKNAPDTARTAQLCEQHYSLCYSDLIYCRLEKCEDLPYKTDDACRTVSSKCTSNGTTCIDRKECTDAPNEIACQIDSSYRNCAWVVEAGRKYCTLKSCTTAPFYYTTEEDCSAYYTNCTTKKGGGCVTKSTCEAVQVKAACTTSSTNERCVWAQDVCRPQICQDYVAKSDNECNIFMKGCITDGVQCISPQPCSKFTTKLACRTGTDGPCVWYSEGCAVFNDCSSIISKYDVICKSASKECTTDGTQCIGLKLCSEYVLKESCVTGTDGECTWIATTNKCKRFLTCYDLPYLTHDQCYTANNKCTTDTKLGCIPLLSCSLYSYQEQCKVSSVGMLRISTTDITQTGLCAWKNDRCLDQSCEDLSGETHELCSAQLKGCTSNGSKCITIANCSTYTNPYTCITAQGIEGPCQLIQNPVSCRSMECSDIVVNYSHEVCQKALSNCISDGTKCIAKDICVNYPNQYACSQEGIDGICAWNGTSCKLMTSCEDAAIDGDACTKQSKKCYWNSNAETKKCIPHTCETKYTTGVCNNVESFDSLSLTICQYSQGKCSEVDPNTLTENDCLENTNSLYRWNLQNKSCYSCSNSLTNSSNSSQIPDATVQYGQTIYFSCLLIMMMMTMI